MANSASSSPLPEREASRDHPDDHDDSIDLRDLFLRLSRGLHLIAGLALLGLVVAGIISLALNRVQPVATSTRVVFSFPGFERGEYPDKSKFQADDLRAPAVVTEAIRRSGLDASNNFQSKIRGALSIEGIVPANIVKERDRLRASGQTPPPYVADEYQVNLTLSRSAGLSDAQRNQLLNEIVSVYGENFQRTYGKAPVAFGTAFETLRTADFPEYELIFNSEMDTIRAYLTEQLEAAKSYRSPSTNFSFKDLMEQTTLFTQIQLNEVLGLIHENGLSRNRATSMMKMNYYLRLLEEREQHALDEEKVVRDLLSQTQSRAQNVVLGVKSQAQSQSDTPLLDQGLIDSLLANDAYNFLVRRALEAGLQVKTVQAEKNRLLNLRDNMQSFVESTSTDQSAVKKQVEESLKILETNYHKLIENIRRTHADYAAQQFGNAVRLGDQVRTRGVLKPLVMAAAVGGFLGLALGGGLSLLGIYIGRARQA
jgi:hypothetical protein